VELPYFEKMGLNCFFAAKLESFAGCVNSRQGASIIVNVKKSEDKEFERFILLRFCK
jgi:hypothetical protein